MHDSAARLDFSAWVRHDQQQFEQIAGRIMAEMDRTALEAARCAGDDPRQMLTREIFAALLDYCRRHTNDLDPSVEHDIPNWIEGNAAALADAHYQRLHLQEQAVGYSLKQAKTQNRSITSCLEWRVMQDAARTEPKNRRG